MRYSHRYLALLLLLLVSLYAVACATPVDTPQNVEAAQVEAIDGTDLNRIVLTERAAQRLDVQTTPVNQMEVDGAERLVIPYAAVVYDVNGGAWIYTSSEPLTFVREAITVELISDDTAVLLEGPSVGTQVVTMGVAELYGIDTGVGK